MQDSGSDSEPYSDADSDSEMGDDAAPQQTPTANMLRSRGVVRKMDWNEVNVNFSPHKEGCAGAAFDGAGTSGGRGSAAGAS